MPVTDAAKDVSVGDAHDSGLDAPSDVEVSTEHCPSPLPSFCECASLNSRAFLFCSQVFPWGRAEEQCAQASMSLAQIDTLAQDKWVVDIARTKYGIDSYWLGGKSDSSLNWTWVDGDTFWQGDAGGTRKNGLLAIGILGIREERVTACTSTRAASGLTTRVTLPASSCVNANSARKRTTVVVSSRHPAKNGWY